MFLSDIMVYWTTKWLFSRQTFSESLCLDSHGNLIFFKFSTFFKQKVLKLRIDSATSSGGQGKVIYFMCFPLLPIEAVLFSSTYCFLFPRAWKILFLIHTCLEDFVSYLYVLGSFFFLFTCARKLLFLISTCLEDFVSYSHVFGRFCFLFIRTRKLLFLIYRCLEAFVSYLQVLGRFCFLFTHTRNLLFLIYMCLEAFVSYLHLLGSFCSLFTRWFLSVDLRNKLPSSSISKYNF
jgi:hypothetical protein